MKRWQDVSGSLVKAVAILLIMVLLGVIFLAYQSPGLLIDFVNFNYCG